MVSGKDMSFVSGNFKAIMPATKAVTPNTISGVAFPISLSMYVAYNIKLDILMGYVRLCWVMLGYGFA